MPDTDKRTMQINEVILGLGRYLEDNPGAKDSIRGVGDWLRQMGLEPNDEILMMALEQMKEANEIDCQIVAGEVIYFRPRKPLRH